MIVVLFDFETNGVESTDSVLEARFNKLYLDNNGNITNQTSFHRYYLLDKGAVFNFGAFSAHGLTIEDIKNKRTTTCLYPETFKEDLPSIMEFLNDSDLLVAHNIDFDYKFLPPMPTKTRFCTMKDVKEIIGAEDINGKLKNPSLVEACTYYGIDFDSDQAHGAEYDTNKLTELFLSIIKSNNNLFFGKGFRPNSGNLFIKNKLGNHKKEIKEKLIEVDGFWFALSDTSLVGNTGSLQAYEKRTGNLFFLFTGLSMKEYLSDIIHSKKVISKISDLISEIGKDNLRATIEDYTSRVGETSIRNLFD